jgi:hypothetical protein
MNKLHNIRTVLSEQNETAITNSVNTSQYSEKYGMYNIKEKKRKYKRLQ